jgi:toxin ParE1/3/4
MKLRVARHAVADLDTIWAYLAKKGGTETAQQVVSSITQRFSLLATNPGAGRSRAELGEGLRSFAAGSYRI